jgi:hypothetical protein
MRKMNMIYASASVILLAVTGSAADAQTSAATRLQHGANDARLRAFQAYVARPGEDQSLRISNSTRSLEDGSASWKGSGPAAGSPNGG